MRLRNSDSTTCNYLIESELLESCILEWSWTHFLVAGVVYFRVELDSFFTCTEVGVVLLYLEEFELERFELVELKISFSDSKPMV